MLELLPCTAPLELVAPRRCHNKGRTWSTTCFCFLLYTFTTSSAIAREMLGYSLFLKDGLHHGRQYFIQYYMSHHIDVHTVKVWPTDGHLDHKQAGFLWYSLSSTDMNTFYCSSKRPKYSCYAVGLNLQLYDRSLGLPPRPRTILTVPQRQLLGLEYFTQLWSEIHVHTKYITTFYTIIAPFMPLTNFTKSKKILPQEVLQNIG